jgi:hypothetical protein
MYEIWCRIYEYVPYILIMRAIPSPRSMLHEFEMEHACRSSFIMTKYSFHMSENISGMYLLSLAYHSADLAIEPHSCPSLYEYSTRIEPPGHIDLRTSKWEDLHDYTILYSIYRSTLFTVEIHSCVSIMFA